MPIIGRKSIFRQPLLDKPLTGLQPSKKTSKPPKPPKEKPIKNNLKDKLEKIKGIGKKASAEIIEEYKDSNSLISAIKKGVFSVGGVDKKKQELILKRFK